jgi:thiol-disulfide isomerase/thioredoxin
MKSATVLLLSLFTVAMVGCAPKRAPKPVTSLPVIGPAPAWHLKDVDGKDVSSDAFKGKVVVVDFWATWCPPCRAEIPGYVELYKKYGKDGLVIVGLSMDEAGPKVVKDFMAKFSITYPMLMADDAVVSAFGSMDSIPTTFLIDRSGQIRDKKVGAVPTEEYERRIAELLN